jgi:RimJ/RimL family protein N-acetyltransferase
MTPNNIFQGKRVRLRAVEPSDWETYWKWSNDTNAQRAESDIGFPATHEEIRAWAERESKRQGKDEECYCIIETLDGEAVGRINSHTCDIRNGTFMFALVIPPENRCKGYATEAIRLLIRYYFDERRYQKCTSLVYSFNEPSMHLHESIGFILEGRIRRMLYALGDYHDQLYYGMTKEEFDEKYPADSW